ncbi:MAG: hypothetical protein ACKVS8_11060 [Phycisphaerales bacterium]
MSFADSSSSGRSVTRKLAAGYQPFSKSPWVLSSVMLRLSPP